MTAIGTKLSWMDRVALFQATTLTWNLHRMFNSIVLIRHYDAMQCHVNIYSA